MCRSGNASNTTRADEWNHASRGGYHVARHVSTITCADERYHARPSPSGKGDRLRRWMRRGTAFNIVETTGAEVERVSETVGNGLCAVPLRGNYIL